MSKGEPAWSFFLLIDAYGTNSIYSTSYSLDAPFKLAS